MGFFKSEAKKTRQQRLASVNQQLLDKLNHLDAEAGSYEKALLEYANSTNWRAIPKSTTGYETTGESFEWIGKGNGPSLAQACFKSAIHMKLDPEIIKENQDENLKKAEL